MRPTLFRRDVVSWCLYAWAAAPGLGAMADSARGKKRFLAACVGIGAVFTAALSLVGPGGFVLCSSLFAVAAFAWTAATVFYDGFLPELTDQPAGMDGIH